MLAKFSVKKPLTVFVAVFMVIILGFVSFTRMTPDLLPSINLPYAMVITAYPGATPEEVEAEISKPMEQAMAALENINSINSVSAENMSQIMLQFSDSANMDTVVPEIREKINGVSGNWPDTVSTPYILKLNPDLLPVTVSAVNYEGMDNIELTEFLNESLMSSLEGISGVASVSVSGSVESQVSVILSEEKIKEVNQKLQNAVTKEFTKAEDELSDKEEELKEGKDQLAGKESELENAKSQLESGQSQLSEGVAQAEKQIAQKRQEIAAAKSQIQEKLSQAKTAKTQLEDSEKLLSALNTQYSQLLKTKDQLDAAVTNLSQLKNSYSALLIKKAELEKQIKELEGGATATPLPTAGPTAVPSQEPSAKPTEAPTPVPTPELTPEPTQEPTAQPTQEPTEQPTPQPTEEPTAQPVPSPESTEEPVSLSTVMDFTGGEGPSAPVTLTMASGGNLEALKAELNTVNGQIKALEDSMQAYGTSPKDLDAKILELQGQKAMLEQSLTAIDGILQGMGISLKDLGPTLGEMRANIEKLEGGISQMETAQKQLEAGEITVDQAMAELNRQQTEGSLKLSSGMSQIVAGQSALSTAKSQMDEAQVQIDSAKKELESGKEKALDGAKVEITMDMVSQLLTAQNFSMPAGYITEDGVQILVRVGDKLTDLDSLSQLSLFDTGVDGVGVVRLSDVADVGLTDNAQDIYTKINGEDGVMLSFSKQPTYATATVSENIQEKFKALSEQYPGLGFSNLSDQGDYIDIVINSVLQNLLLGAVLAVFILLLFLKDIKPTFIIACSIPISVLFAIVLMYFSGISLNVISLSGLAVGVGMLVDNSVVVIENIYRMRGEGKSAIKAAVAGAAQVTGAIVASTLTTICVFLPIVFVEGLTRQLFQDMALTIAYSLLASLIVAVTLVPAMASGMMRKNKEQNHKLFNKFLDIYESLARRSLKHRWIVLAASLLLLIGSTVLCLQKGFIFMPSMSGTQITVSVTPPEDASFKEKSELADQVYARVSAIPELETVGVMIADSGSMMGMGGSGMGGGSISMYAIMGKDSKRKDAEISKEIVEKCADLEAEISAQGSMDMGSYMTAMGGEGVSVKLYGAELDNLIQDADSLVEKLNGVEGLQNASAGMEDATPELRVVVDKDKAAKKGLTVAQVYSAVASKVKTEQAAGSVSLDGSGKDIVIYSEANQNMRPEDLRAMKLSVTDKQGEKKELKLTDVAKVLDTKSLSSVKRENQRRVLTISAEVAEGYNVTKVTDAAKASLESFTPMEGNSLKIGGESDAIMDAMEQLVYMALLAIVIIYFIMVAQFQSFLSPFIVMFTIPLAFTGGFIALLITGREISVVSMVGFIMLAGIIVNNGIVLIDYINILRLEGMEKREAIIIAGRTRMRPILMTALTTVLGLVFMAIGTGFGSEMMQPMAIVCIGGLLYATLMTLFVVPAMYDLLNKGEMKRRDVE